MRDETGRDALVWCKKIDITIKVSSEDWNEQQCFDEPNSSEINFTRKDYQIIKTFQVFLW